jgi:hypothetical protein
MNNPMSSLGGLDLLMNVLQTPVQAVTRLFDWDVEERDLFTKYQYSSTMDSDEYGYSEHYGQVSGYKAITRSGGDPNDQVLHVAPISYQIISNAQFEDIIADYEKIGCSYIDHGEFNNGRQLWCQLESNELAPWLVGDTDQGKTRITLVTSHNGSLALKVLLMMERVFCANQLPFFSKAKNVGFVIKHTKSAESRISLARQQISAIGDLARQAVESFQLLNATPINVRENEAFFSGLFGMKKEIRFSQIDGITVPSAIPEYSGKAVNMLNALGDAYSHDLQSDLGNNAWRLLNAVTYYVDHSPHIREGRRNKGYSMTGAGAMIKHRAYTKLIERAKIGGSIISGWQPSGLIQ